MARMTLEKNSEWGREEIWMGCCIIINGDGAELNLIPLDLSVFWQEKMECKMQV